MEGRTYIQVPNNIMDPIALRRVLVEVIKHIDKAIGLSGDSPYISIKDLESIAIASPTLLSLTSSNPEIQQISDKLDELIVALRLTPLMD